VRVSEILWKFTEFQSIEHHWKKSVLPYWLRFSEFSLDFRDSHWLKFRVKPSVWFWFSFPITKPVRIVPRRLNEIHSKTLLSTTLAHKRMGKYDLVLIFMTRYSFRECRPTVILNDHREEVILSQVWGYYWERIWRSARRWRSGGAGVARGGAGVARGWRGHCSASGNGTANISTTRFLLKPLTQPYCSSSGQLADEVSTSAKLALIRQITLQINLLTL